MHAWYLDPIHMIPYAILCKVINTSYSNLYIHILNLFLQHTPLWQRDPPWRARAQTSRLREVRPRQIPQQIWLYYIKSCKPKATKFLTQKQTFKTYKGFFSIQCDSMWIPNRFINIRQIVFHAVKTLWAHLTCSFARPGLTTIARSSPWLREKTLGWML